MPSRVAGHRLATLVGATAVALTLATLTLAACSGSQIDERTATPVDVTRGAATSVALPIVLGGRADEAFGGLDGLDDLRVEPAPSNVSTTFVTQLAALPDAVELTESVGLRYVSHTSATDPESVVIALAFGAADADRLASLEAQLVDGLSGGGEAERVTLGGEPVLLVDTVDQASGQPYQVVFWQGERFDLVVVGLQDNRASVEKIATAMIEANREI